MRHRRNLAVSGIALMLLAGCGGPRGVPQPVATGPVLPPPPRPTTLDSVFVLESGGPPPEDTVVVVPSGRRRTILLRRGAPDNSLFATLEFPDSALAGGDSLRITVSARPGLYAIDLAVDGQLARPGLLTMSYAVHFVAPAGSGDRYGNDLAFERALFLARLGANDRVEFLPTARPGSDLVATAVDRPGRYLVAAPRY
ncbi:MAG: hypothetical protein AB7L66_08105 [Gemmatimonadales bacterium]